jgi:hypothetical protein
VPMLCAFCKGVLLPRTLIIVILSDVRRSVATERESKDLCIASLPKVAIREFSPCTLCPNDLPRCPRVRVRSSDANLGCNARHPDAHTFLLPLAFCALARMKAYGNCGNGLKVVTWVRYSLAFA